MKNEFITVAEVMWKTTGTPTGMATSFTEAMCRSG